MFIQMVVPWLMLAGLIFIGLSAFVVAHYAWTRLGCEGRRRSFLRRRLPACFIAGGLLFLQLMSELYSPGTTYVLREIQKEDADDDEDGDPESPEKQLGRQLKAIRRGKEVGDLVLRL